MRTRMGLVLLTVLLAALSIGVVFNLFHIAKSDYIEPPSTVGHPFSFHIDRLPMGDALIAWARVTRSTFSFTGEFPPDLVSKPVDGVYEPQKALCLVLAGSGYTFLFSPRGSRGGEAFYLAEEGALNGSSRVVTPLTLICASPLLGSGRELR